jgi:hypothetical protein
LRCIYVEAKFFLLFEGSEFGENGLIRLAAHGLHCNHWFPLVLVANYQQFAACFLGGGLGGLGFSGLGWYLDRGLSRGARKNQH